MVTDSLKVFVMVAELQNFSKAAKELNISQPGVSLHIRNLEHEFGVKLVHRSSKYCKLTEAGEILFHHAKQILSRYDEAKDKILMLRNEVSGSIKIGASYTIGEYILPHLIAQFVKQYPQVDVQAVILNTEQIAHDVRANELDIGLVEGKVDDIDIPIKQPFMKDELVLVAAPHHHISASRIVEPDQLQDQVWIMRESGSGTRTYSDQFLQDLELEVRKQYVFSSNQSVKEAVMAELGIALLSRWAVRRELETGDLSEVQVHGYQLWRPFYILQHSAKTSPMAVRMFKQKLDELEW